MVKITAKIIDLLKIFFEKICLLKNKPIDFWLITGIKIGVVLIIFSPLVLGPFGVTVGSYPKAVFVRSLIEFIFILYVLLAFFNPKYLPKSSPLTIAVSLFVAAIFLSGFFGINFYRSFFGELHRAEGIILYVHLLVLFLITVSVFRKKEEWLNIFRITVIVGGLSSITGLLQGLQVFSFWNIEYPSPRISGTLTNPVFFGNYLVLPLFLGILLLVQEKRKSLKILWLLISFLNLFALILSQTRGAWIGLAVGLFFLFFLWLFLYPKPQAKLTKTILLAILFFLIFVFLITLYQDKLSLVKNQYFQTAVSIFDLVFSPTSRLMVWHIAIEAWKERPIFGWGPESFSFVYDKFFKAQYLPKLPENLFFDRVHNAILDLLVSTGIVGILSYLSIFFVLFYLIFRYIKLQKNKGDKSLFCSLILASLLVAYFVENIFAFDTISTLVIFFLILGFVNNNFKPTEKGPTKAIIPEACSLPQKLINIFLVISYIFFSLLTFYYVNFKPTKASLLIIQGMRLERKDFSQALSYYKRGITQGTVYDFNLKVEIIERLLSVWDASWVKEGHKKEIAEILAGLKPLLEKNLEKQNRTSTNFYELVVRIDQKLYLYSGNSVFLLELEEFSKKAIEFNNQTPRFYQFLGKAKIYQQKYQEGENFYQIALNLTPKRPEDKIDSYKSLGISYFEKKNAVKAAENFKKAFEIEYLLKKLNPGTFTPEKDIVFTEKVALLFCELNDFETCRNIYERAIEIYPTQRKLLQSHFKTLFKEEAKAP
jgi:putative inorganic carbon (HCO3(-)) transporter